MLRELKRMAKFKKTGLLSLRGMHSFVGMAKLISIKELRSVLDHANSCKWKQRAAIAESIGREDCKQIMSELLKQNSAKGPRQSTRFGAALDTVRNSALVNKLKTKTSPLHREILSHAIDFDVRRIAFQNREEEEKDANARESAAQRAAVAQRQRTRLQKWKKKQLHFRQEFVAQQRIPLMKRSGAAMRRWCASCSVRRRRTLDGRRRRRLDGARSSGGDSNGSAT